MEEISQQQISSNPIVVDKFQDTFSSQQKNQKRYLQNLAQHEYLKTQIFSVKDKFQHNNQQVEKIQLVLNILNKKGNQRLQNICQNSEIQEIMDNIKNNTQLHNVKDIENIDRKAEEQLQQQNKFQNQLLKIFGYKYVQNQKLSTQKNYQIRENHIPYYQTLLDEQMPQKKVLNKIEINNDYSQKFQNQNQNQENYIYKQDFLIKQKYFQKLNPIQKANEVLFDSIYLDIGPKIALNDYNYQQIKQYEQLNCSYQKSLITINKEIKVSEQLSKIINKQAKKQKKILGKSLDKINTFFKQK